MRAQDDAKPVQVKGGKSWKRIFSPTSIFYAHSVVAGDSNDLRWQCGSKGNPSRQALEMSIAEAADFFSEIPKLKQPLNCLVSVGLGYMPIGQPATTISGGESQRIKLASELARTNTGNTLYILDEPTTGLHSSDVFRLIDVLQGFVERGTACSLSSII